MSGNLVQTLVKNTNLNINNYNSKKPNSYCLYTLLGAVKIMEYYLAEIQILKLTSFYQLIKAESFEKAQEIAEREFSVKDGYRVNLKVTLQ